MFHKGGADSLFKSFIKLSLRLLYKLAKIVGCHVFEVWIVVDAVFKHFVNHLASWLGHVGGGKYLLN